MEKDNQILLALGWQLTFKPVFFLGMDISWLVMEEAYLSPYDHKDYGFDEAMRIEAHQHPGQVARLSSAA